MSTVFDPNSTPMVVSLSYLNLPSRNCMSTQDLPTPESADRSTGIANDDVLEEIAVVIHPSALLHKLQELQVRYMAQPSQIFEVLVSPQEYQLMQDQNDELRDRNAEMAREIEDLNEKMRLITNHGQDILEGPNHIFHLSKRLLQSGRQVINLQQALEEEQKGISKKIGEIEVSHQQQIAALQASLLSSQVELAEKSLQSQQKQQQIQTLSQQVDHLRLQIVTEKDTISRLSQLLESKVQEIHTMQGKLKQKEEVEEELNITMLNERNMMEEQVAQIKKKEKEVREKTEKLEQKKLKIIEEYEAWETEKRKLEKQFNERYEAKQRQLLENFRSRQQQLQQQYAKSIASIHSFSVCDTDTEELKQQIEGLNKKIQVLSQQNQKLSQQKSALEKKVLKLKKDKEAAIDQVSYLKEVYSAQDTIIKGFTEKLFSFRDRLQQIESKDNIKKMVAEKKNQMMRAIDKELQDKLK